MKVLMAGGGSGGHVTPLRAVIKELQKLTPTLPEKQLRITVVTDRGFFPQTKFLFKDNPDISLVKIFSGKFRRYNNLSVWWHLTHLPTILKNLRDLIYIALGILQSLLLFLGKRKPDVVFCKGGFVCLPVGIAARIFRVPLIVHDSDTHPGLTNRILSRWATKIATGMPTKYYSYPATKTTYTGIPVSSDFKGLSESKQQTLKKELGFQKELPLLLVTGGGTGADTLNGAVLENAPELLRQNIQIALVTGRSKAGAAEKFLETLDLEVRRMFKVYEFTEMAPLVLAADIVVTRAGATAMQEFSNAKKSVLIVPSPYLTGGHQLKNAEMFMEQNAAYVLQEAELSVPGQFVRLVLEVSADSHIAENLHTHFAKPKAATELARLIAKVG